jgi:hypothetical protein
MFHDIETAYNDAVARGDAALAERFAAVWLWLIETERAPPPIAPRPRPTKPVLVNVTAAPLIPAL